MSVLFREIAPVERVVVVVAAVQIVIVVINIVYDRDPLVGGGRVTDGHNSGSNHTEGTQV